MTSRLDALTGVLLGTAVGDALGLPREGLSPRRALRLFGGAPLRHGLLFRHGMVSDDTEHACMTAQALLGSPHDAERFARSLAWRLRFWLLGVPAGVGLSTLRAILKLWIGFSPRRSGVWSAGNGPAMRAPLLGVCLGHDPDRLRAYVRASTRLTHTDPKAERGALILALAAHQGARLGPDSVCATSFFTLVRSSLPDADAPLLALLELVERHLAEESSSAALVEKMGLRRGVTGYIYHTLAAALFCWLRWPGDFRRAVEEVILLGGDADSTGAVTGALVGATMGAGAIPVEWLRGLWEWPRSVTWIRKLAARLAEQFPAEGTGVRVGPLPLFWPGVLPRNLLFLLVVLTHGLRRLLPPY